MLSFLKKIIFSLGIIAIAVFLYQNQEPITSTMSFTIDLSWFATEEMVAEAEDSSFGKDREARLRAEGWESPGGEKADEEAQEDKGWSFFREVEPMVYKTLDFPVLLMILAAFIFGMVLAGFHGIYERIARKAGERSRSRRIKSLEGEVDRLKQELDKAREAEYEAPVGDHGAKPAQATLVEPPAQKPKEELTQETRPKPMLEEPTL